MPTHALRTLSTLAFALALLPLPAEAQGLPTGKRQHKPVSVKASPATSPESAYRLDAEAGEVRFGDGVRGRRPPSGESAAEAPSYRAGTPREPLAPAGATPSQHGQTDQEFLKQRARGASEAAGEQEPAED